MSRRMLFAPCFIAVITWAQTGAPPTSAPSPPPPIESPPAKQRRIRIGQDQEYHCNGPAAFWICPSVPSERQLVEYERTVQLNPEDVCARGQIISHYPLAWINRGKESRLNHLVWMIQNHPEWDGFTANPRRSLANPRSAQERSSYVQLKEAWLQQVGPAQQSGKVLHNGAMFFALRDREFAVELLRRAIALEPQELVYVERLGMLYALSLLPAECFEPSGVPESPTFKALARQAEDALARSYDWILLAGALTATHSGCTVGDIDLYERVQELRPGEDPWSVVDKLPSRTSDWCRSKCIAAK